MDLNGIKQWKMFGLGLLVMFSGACADAGSGGSSFSVSDSEPTYPESGLKFGAGRVPVSPSVPPVLRAGGAFAAAASSDSTEAVAAAIDVLRIREPLPRATLHLRVQGIDARAPALLSVSIRDHGAAPSPVATGPGTAIAVPPRSQMVLRSDLASHVCSPTSVAMLLDYYGHSTDIYELIAAARHQPSGLYGVWPANIHAAAQRGPMGYLLHFPTWDAARALLDAGLPIIASVRYEEGELRDAAIRRTNGHLLVLRGYDGDKVLGNDPAAKTDPEVKRSYDLAEFCRVWLGNSAVGYVLYK